VSKRLQIAPGKKRYTFDGTGLTLVFPNVGTYPNGEVVVSRLFVAPDTLPAITHRNATDYWILQNYGMNTTFTAPAEIWFSKIGAMPADLPAAACKLWRRNPVAHGPLWQDMDVADVLNEGPSASLGFITNNQLTSAGQFWLELPGLVEVQKPNSTSSLDLVAADLFRIFPNPVAENGTLQLYGTASGTSTFRLFDAKGNQIRVVKFEGNGRLSLHGLPTGTYAYRIESADALLLGQVVVVE
jgi:hypothetical protein